MNKDTEAPQQEDIKRKPRHTKKENYEFMYTIWGRVVQDHPRFADLPADDMLGFYKEFRKLPNIMNYIPSNT